MPLSSVEFWRRPAATLAFLVGIVVLNCSQPQMVGIDTGGIVSAGTVVQNAEAGRDSTVMNQPTDPMGLDWAVPVATPGHVAIALRGSCSNPKPTTSSLSYQSPETVNKVLRKSMLGENRVLMTESFTFPAFASVWNPATLFLHNQFDWLCRASGCFSTAGAFLFWDNSPMLFNYKLRLALNHERRAAVRSLHHVLVTGRGLGHSAFYPLVLVQTR